MQPFRQREQKQALGRRKPGSRPGDLPACPQKEEADRNVEKVNDKGVRSLMIHCVFQLFCDACVCLSGQCVQSRLLRIFSVQADKPMQLPFLQSAGEMCGCRADRCPACHASRSGSRCSQTASSPVFRQPGSGKTAFMPGRRPVPFPPSFCSAAFPSSAGSECSER